MSNQTTTATISRIKAIREKLGLTQQQMADELSCSLSAERRYEYEDALPGTIAGKKALAKLAKRAGIEIESVLA